MFHQWFDSSSPKKSKRRPATHLNLEPLEDRRVPSFTPGATESLVDDAVDMVSGDFNDDGIVDVVAISEDSVKRINGDGNGGFGGTAELILADGLKSIASGDFNKDGDLDVVVTSVDESKFFLLTNNGDGTFSEAGSFSVTGDPNDIAVGDFDKDGNLDVAVSHETDFNGGHALGVDIFLGNGSDSFANIGCFANGNSRGNIAVSDFDKDGDADLFVTDPDNGQVGILLGDGTGNFIPGSVLTTAPGAYDVATGDFNHDGRTDLAVTNRDFDRLIFEDDFNSNTVGQPLPYPWAQTVGSFLVQPNGDNFADSNTASFNLALVGNPTANGVKVQAFVDLTTSVFGEGAGVVTRSSGNSILNMYWGTIFKTGANTYRADIWANGFGTWYLLSTSNLAGFSGAGTVRFETIGTSLQLFVDDVLAAETFNGAFGQGFAGIMSLGINPKIDDFTYTEIVPVANDSLSILTQTAGGDFNDAVNTFIGNNPSKIAVHDFSKDGKEDLVITNEGDNNIAILLGEGDGTFSFKANVDTGASPLPIVKGDFNRDGKFDVAVGTTWPGNQVQNFLSDFFNPSTGNFEAQQNIPANAGTLNDPNAVAVGDFNEDGILDYIVTEFSGNEATVFLGNGNGNFNAGPVINLASDPVDIAVGDFDNDGHQDVAIALQSISDVEVLFGDGTGDFGSATQLSVDTGTVGKLAVGDFNGDHNSDIAVAVGTDDVIVFLSNGDRTFQGSQGVPLLANGGDLVTGDFNEDGDVDLAVALSGGSSVEILLGNGDGTFTNTTGGSLEVTATPNLIAVGDFNNDDNLDLITADSDEFVTTFLGNGDGTFGPAQRQDALFSLAGITVTDLNHDQLDDVVGASINRDGAVVTLLSDGDGTFSVNDIGSAGNNDQTDIASGDFNKDGNPDILIVDDSDNFVAEWLGDGNGDFKFPNDFSPDGKPSDVVTADFNMDGKLDYAVANRTANNVSVFLNNGAGGFDEGTFGVGDNPVALAAADVDMDGDIDIVTADFNDNTVTVLKNNGTGQGFSSESFSTGAEPVDIALGDFDQDGDPDLVTLNDLNNDYTLLENADGMGDFGSFAPVNFTLEGIDPRKIAVGDFNNDNRLDLASTNATVSDNSVEILLSDGPNSFTYEGSFAVGTNPSGIAVGDFNKDGDPDLAVAATGISEVEVYLGDGTGQFSLVFSGSAGDQPISVAVGDFDMDGNPDIVSANRDNTFSTFLGDGTGDFTPRKYRIVNNGFFAMSTAVAVGDFNHDGVQDLVITDDNDRETYVVNGLKREQILSEFQFLTQPVDVIAAQILPEIQVQVLDQFGNPIRQSGLLVTISLNQFSANLAGTLTVATDADGIAVFNDLRIGIAATDYQLIASIGDVSALSDPFDVFADQSAFDRRWR